MYIILENFLFNEVLVGVMRKVSYVIKFEEQFYQLMLKAKEKDGFENLSEWLRQQALRRIRELKIDENGNGGNGGSEQ